MDAEINSFQLFLPVDDKEMRSPFMMHVARILVTHTKYKFLDLLLLGEWHMKHQYYKEMSVKSTIVCDIEMLLEVK